MPSALNESSPSEPHLSLSSADAALRDEIRTLANGLSLEVTPAAIAKAENLASLFERGSEIYITFLPGASFADTLATARTLIDAGYKPVPHFAARSIADRRALEGGLAAMKELGMASGLLIAGGIPKAIGEFSDTMQLLATGLFERHGFLRLAVAGHPEGSPDIKNEAISEARVWKQDYADRNGIELSLATQFCFTAQPIVDWERQLRASGCRMPAAIGTPGPATLKTLIAYAKACGVGASMRILTKQAKKVTQLLKAQAPDRLIADLARHRLAEPETLVRRLHFYPFGGLKRTASWIKAVRQGNFRLNGRGGFEVDEGAI